MIYALNQNNQMLWYQHLGAADGVDAWYTTPEPAGCIASGWNYTHVFADGNGAIYMIDANGFLRWIRHAGYVDGSANWIYTPETKGYIGEGWNMKHVFSGGNGIIYAVNEQNQLLWYKHLGNLDGTDRWQTTPEKKGYIGVGWDMKHVFSGGNGIIYAINQQNQLLWYKHLGYADGTDRWQTTPEKKGYIGVGWDMKIVTGGGFAPRNIGLRMQFQQTSQWCWIAVGTSVDHYYNPAGRVTQASLMTYIGHTINQFPANTNAYPTAAVLAANPSVANALAHPILPIALTVLDSPKLLIDVRYDKSGGVGDALINHWAKVNGGYQPSISLAQLTQEINAGRPVVFNLQFPTFTHFVAVAGVLNDLLLVCDPAAGESVISYKNFPAAYRGGASLIGVALTQPGASVGDL